MPDPIARRIHELLNQAMDFERGERQAFLQQACKDTPELAKRVDQLISAVEDSHSFLEEPALRILGDDVWTSEAEFPRVIGNYEITRKLGSGGMGNVYEAVQRQPHRTVALKIPRIRRWNQDKRQQMRYEAELLGRLRHANIAQVYEAGVDDSDPERPVPYFAMEFVPSARTIRQHVLDQQLGLIDVLRLLRTVCEAIQHAHGLGIIHRDLKPANILVDTDGTPKVIDFGVASSDGFDKALVSLLPSNADPLSRSREGLDGSPPMAGTLNYMSPEQCDPTVTVDVRTDVYSLGVILFELLCDSSPYDLKGLPISESLEKIRSQSPRTATRHGHPLPADVQTILRKALAKDRTDRYSSVEALSEDIRLYLESRPISARRATFGYIMSRTINRNRWMTLAIGLLVFAIATGSIASAWFAWQAADEIQKRRLAEADALQQRDDAVWQSYIANMQGAFAAFQNRETALVRTRLMAAPEPHRNWEWDFLQGMVEISEQVVKAHDDMILSFGTSPDGTRWATGANDGVVRVWDSQSREMIADITLPFSEKQGEAKPPAIYTLQFRNGSTQLVTGSTDGIVRIWDIDSARLERELKGHRAPVTTISVRPDGLIASTCEKKRAKLWDGEQDASIGEINDEQTEIGGLQYCDEGRLLVTWDALGSVYLRDGETRKIIRRYNYGRGPRRVCASKDGRWIAAGGRESRVQLWQTETSDTEGRTIEIPGRRSSTDSLAFSPDNRRLAVGRVNREIVQFSMDDFKKVELLQGHEEFVRGVAYDRSGKRLVSASGDGTMRVWNLETDGRGNIKTWTDNDFGFSSLAVSPKGDTIAVVDSDRSIGLYEEALNRIRKFPKKPIGAIQAIAWSPLGDTIASAGLDRSVYLWSVDTGDHVVLNPPHSGPVHALAYSPDGKSLVSSGTERVLRVWDVEKQVPAFELTGHKATVVSVAFSHDGSCLASGSVDGSTILWDWQTRKIKHKLEGHRSNVYALAFHPHENRLYSGSRDRTIRVWSIDDGKPLNVLDGHGQLIRSLDIHPDGSRMVAGSWFGDLLFWDLKKHQLITTFPAHSDIVYDLEFSPLGDYFVSCSLDKTIQKWTRSRKYTERGGP